MSRMNTKYNSQTKESNVQYNAEKTDKSEEEEGFNSGNAFFPNSPR